MKLDPAGPYTVYDEHQPRQEGLQRRAQFCSRIREGVGGRADLLFGTPGQLSVLRVKCMAKMIETADPLWIQEPCPPERSELMAEVARSLSLPVRVCAPSMSLLVCGTVSIFLADYTHVESHLYCGPVVGTATIKLAFCSPNFLIL